MKTLKVKFNIKNSAMREKFYSALVKTKDVQVVGRPGAKEIKVISEDKYPDILVYGEWKKDIEVRYADNFTTKLDLLFLSEYPIDISDSKAMGKLMSDIRDIFDNENIDIYTVHPPKEDYNFWLINWVDYDDCVYPEDNPTIKTYIFNEEVM